MTKLLLILALAASLPAQFVSPAGWCSGSHCDPSLTDNSGHTSPTAFGVLCKDTVAQGSNAGGGVSTNGSIIAASYANNNSYTNPYLVVYDASIKSGGTCHQLWSSNLFDTWAWSFPPLIGSHDPASPVPDEVIQADDVKIIAFNAAGGIVWNTCWYSGTPPSACLCPDGSSSLPCPGSYHPLEAVPITDGAVSALIVGIHGSSAHKGPIFEVNSATGAIMGSTYLDAVGNNSYSPNNIPCAGTTPGRFFIITNFSNNPALGRMYGVGVANGVFSVGTTTGSFPWAYSFLGPTGGSPLCVNAISPAGVFSDGSDVTNPQSDLYGWEQNTGNIIYACMSSGGTGCTTVANTVAANSALDPRGGWWVPCPSCSTLTRRSTTAGTPGNSLQSITLTHIIAAEPCSTFLSSIVNVSTLSNGDVALNLGLDTLAGCNGGSNSAAYLAVLDATTGTLVNAYKVAADDTAAPGIPEGQAPIAQDSRGLPLLFFTSSLGGITMLGDTGGSVLYNNAHYNSMGH